MANPFLYIICTKAAWEGLVPAFMLDAWGIDGVTPTWEQAMTHEFPAGRVAGPIRWKEGDVEIGTQLVFKMMWLPDVEIFLNPLIDYIIAHPAAARIMGHDETITWLETHDWNVTIDEL